MWYVILDGRCIAAHDTRESAAQHAASLEGNGHVVTISRATARRRNPLL